MFKSIFLKFILFITLFLIFSKISQADINIVIKVDDEIITNHDLEKEINYLKILNPNLIQISNDQNLKIAKESLISEKIKKKYVSQFIDITIASDLSDQYIKDFYNRLNILNDEDFNFFLKKNNTYNLQEFSEKIKIELFWNDLIYKKFFKSVNINRDKIVKNLEKKKNMKTKDYLLSEIIILKKNDLSHENIIDQISLSIDEIGFDNTANIYSTADSNKVGGKLDWINENSLSQEILRELNNLNEGEVTNAIQISNKIIILKLEKTRERNLDVDINKEIEKLIEIETEKQLTQFSKIYFNKIRMNFTINAN